MPVGDSMTIGSAGEHTWRYRMWQHLCGTYGGPFTLVGPRETLYDKLADAPVSYAYADPDFPRAHLAGWGEGWLHMAPLIGEAVRACRADVLLVSLGLIDLGFYTNAEQTAANARTFVANARAADVPCALIVDAGTTEFHGVPTKTCCAVGPAWADAVDAITGGLPLL